MLTACLKKSDLIISLSTDLELLMMTDNLSPPRLHFPFLFETNNFFHRVVSSFFTVLSVLTIWFIIMKAGFIIIALCFLSLLRIGSTAPMGVTVKASYDQQIINLIGRYVRYCRIC